MFFIEETKFRSTGKLKIDNFFIYELVRQTPNGGGGLAIGIIEDLNPVWVREGDDITEALSIDILVNTMRIRCCIAYGCQETDKIERKESFWKYLDQDVIEAKRNDKGFILHFDGNLWAGNKIVPGDPHHQNKNGQLFEQFLN